MKRAWVVQKAKEKLQEMEDLQQRDLQSGLKTKHGVDVKDPAARKAMAKARSDRDDEEASFDLLPLPVRDLEGTEPGNNR